MVEVKILFIVTALMVRLMALTQSHQYPLQTTSIPIEKCHCNWYCGTLQSGKTE